MSVAVVVNRVAEREAEDAATWYERKKMGLGTDFLAKLQRTLNDISQHPDRFAVVAGDTREAAVARFPYCVYYRSLPGQVVVTAVFHTSRDPSIWQSR